MLRVILTISRQATGNLGWNGGSLGEPAFEAALMRTNVSGRTAVGEPRRSSHENQPYKLMVILKRGSPGKGRFL